jgi:tRNA modification GTPase
LEELKEKIKEVIFQGKSLSEDGVVVTHERHKIHLVEASSAIERGMDGLRMGRFPELVAVDLMEALESLGAIIGEKVEEEILDRIFSEFCIGK